MTLVDPMRRPRQAPPRFGKHRAKVINNVDPEGRARLQLSVPEVYGPHTINWALPSVPFAGSSVGLHLVPPIGANVWVEFEKGDIDYPIWSGCFWAAGESPAQLPSQKMLKTETATLSIDDLNPDAVVTIESTTGHKIVIGAAGITITTSAGAVVELSGPKVSVNNGALEVI